MIQILKKTAPALSTKAGPLARQWIEQQGLEAADVDYIPGAAGGPKGIGIQGLDQAIFGNFFAQAPKRRTVIGSSIGSWRFASILAWGAVEGTQRLAELYTDMHFEKGMSRLEVSQTCAHMLDQLIAGREQQMLQHPDYHLTVVSVKAKHLFQSDQNLALLASIAGIVGANTLARKHCKHFMQRVISQPADAPQFHLPADAFETQYHALNNDNLKAWLMASASIPGAMSAIRDIPHAPAGSYRDGGLIDYHMDLPYASSGIVLYPHFCDHIIPGWFDKPWRTRHNDVQRQARTLLISPSQAYLDSLPLGRLPYRKDFVTKGMTPSQRQKIWRQSVAESQRLGDAFLELQASQNFAALMQPL